MKMKIPFSEKFLLALYDVTQELSEVVEVPSSMKDYIYHDAFKIRRGEERERARKDFYKLVHNLKQNGYIKTLRAKGGSRMVLTSKGWDKIFTIKLKMIDRKKRKDQKWQMVLFDIPEIKKKDRDLFRKGLRYLGYVRLQKSIWVCKYDTLKETKELIKQYKLSSFADLLLVDKIKMG